MKWLVVYVYGRIQGACWNEKEKKKECRSLSDAVTSRYMDKTISKTKENIKP